MKNIYFTGDILRGEDVPGHDDIHACFLIIKTCMGARVLLAVAEDKDKIDEIRCAFFMTGGCLDSCAGYIRQVFLGYKRPCDIILLGDNMCFYHIWGSHMLVLMKSERKHVILRQENWFMSEKYPFWNKERIRPGNLLLYGDGMDADDSMFGFLYSLFHANMLFKKYNMKYKSAREMLEIIKNGRFNMLSLIGVDRRRWSFYDV